MQLATCSRKEGTVNLFNLDDEPPPSSAAGRLADTGVRPGAPGRAPNGRSRNASIPAQNARTACFRRLYFPDATDHDWNDWRWQLKHRVSNTTRLRDILRLSRDEQAGLESTETLLPAGITPHYLEPIRKGFRMGGFRVRSSGFRRDSAREVVL